MFLSVSHALYSIFKSESILTPKPTDSASTNDGISGEIVLLINNHFRDLSDSEAQFEHVIDFSETQKNFIRSAYAALMPLAQSNYIDKFTPEFILNGGDMAKKSIQCKLILGPVGKKWVVHVVLGEFVIQTKNSLEEFYNHLGALMESVQFPLPECQDDLELGSDAVLINAGNEFKFAPFVAELRFGEKQGKESDNKGSESKDPSPLESSNPTPRKSQKKAKGTQNPAVKPRKEVQQTKVGMEMLETVQKNGSGDSVKKNAEEQMKNQHQHQHQNQQQNNKKNSHAQSNSPRREDENKTVS